MTVQEAEILPLSAQRPLRGKIFEKKSSNLTQIYKGGIASILLSVLHFKDETLSQDRRCMMNVIGV